MALAGVGWHNLFGLEEWFGRLTNRGLAAPHALRFGSAACSRRRSTTYLPVGERTSHFLAVTGDTPATAAALAGVCPWFGRLTNPPTSS